jgi:glucose/arabinose dehydrogenase
MRRSVRRVLSGVLTSALVGAVLTGLGPVADRPADAAPPAGFVEQVVFSGLTAPTKLVFAPDGRVFVGQKNGIIKVFDNLADPTPTVFADLRANVYDYEDLGLIGLAVPPTFPADPYVYVSYTYDGRIGGSAPTYNDTCASPGNCVSSARVSRLKAAGDVMTGSEQVLLHDWCHQIESHSIGELHFGPDGKLYVTGGEGASATFVDYGQAGTPSNPCGDPPAAVGGSMTPPTAEGGALRSQDLRTTGDPTGLSGTLIRVDPATGAAPPDNPLAASTDPNARRILTYGLRNPFRWTFRPGTDEVWAGDVGWRTWEEIDRITGPVTGPVRNYGWPCYEGNNHQSGFDSANLNLCESLYAAGTSAVVGPYFTYRHTDPVVPGESCPTGGSSPSGVAFYPTSGGGYPADYAGALFFADYSRGCIWAMRTGADGLPDPTRTVSFNPTAATPVDLEIGPDGDLYYADLAGGTIRRFHYASGNQAPVAVITATPTSGNAPLAVSFDGTASSDPDAGDMLTYAWDFTGDGTVDATGPTAGFTYATSGTYTAKLRVTDSAGATSTASTQILVGTGGPVPVIDTPATGTLWSVGQTVGFSGHATDPQEGTLPPSALSWQLVNRHCDFTGSCHTHLVLSSDGVASGSFVGPDHEYPSHLELTLTATDSSGLTGSTTLRLDPRTVNLNLASSPSGLQVNLNGVNRPTPATVPVIVGSTNTLSAPSPQGSGGSTYSFTGWSDGGGQTHVVTAPGTATTYTATYAGTSSCADVWGHTCATVDGRPLDPTDTVLPLTGDDAYTQVSLPFPVSLYGRPYTAAWVDVNGRLSFQDPGRSWGVNATLPDPPAPNAAVYPFWDDLVVRSDSSIRTGVAGTAPDRRFVVEWRNIGVYGSSSARVTVQASVSESGQVVLDYADLSGSRELGDSATVGIEDAAGSVALQYSANQPVLANNRAIVITPPGTPPPGTGTLTGKVTDAATGAAIEGATVSVSPGGLSTDTGPDGTWALDGVPPGSYTVSASATGGLAGSAPATVTAGAATTVDLALTATATPTTYTRGTETRTFVPADGTVLPLTGDDAVTQVTLPFPVPVYGRTYSSAWVSTNGFVSFTDPGGAQPINAALPDVAAPNAAVYPFWDDLRVWSDSSVRTGVVGSAPNRRFVVEWRNVGHYGSASARLTVEAVFAENGEIWFNYADLTGTKPRELGDSATVGVEDPSGTSAVQHSYNQPVLVNGQAVVFRPAA